MTDKKLNAGNDNIYLRRFFRYRNRDDGDELALMKHIPLADMLIKKYSKRPYKHSVDHPDRAFLEYQLCTILGFPSQSPAQRTFLLGDLSSLLEISPLELMKESSLPFDAKGLARFP